MYVYNSTVTKTQKMETIQMSIHDWLYEQIVVIRTMEYYSVIRRKELLIHSTMWMTFEKILVSESSQTQKVMSCLTLFKWHTQNRYIHQGRKQIGTDGCQGLGGLGCGEWLLTGCGLPLAWGAWPETRWRWYIYYMSLTGFFQKR